MMALTEPRDDERLLAGWRAGDPESVRRVVALWGPAMLRVALAVCRRLEDAEEVVQDALLLAHLSLDEFDPRRGSARTWLIGVTLNRARQVRRGQRRYAGLLDRFFQQPYETASHQAMRTDLAFARESLGTLPAREREAFVLVEMEELETEEAANVMGVTSSTVRVLLARARQHLRDRSQASAALSIRVEGESR
jgi:RNA polymerase sigma-70 factor (ECF subfamily)